MGEIIRFDVGLPPKALRRNSETRNVHHKARLVREYQEQVWCAGSDAQFHYDNRRIDTCFKSGRIDPKKRAEWNTGRQPWERAHVKYTWRSTHPTDADNIVASMKPALDVLKGTGPRPLGIIVEDGPGITVEGVWEKARKADEGVLIEILRRD